MSYLGGGFGSPFFMHLCNDRKSRIGNFWHVVWMMEYKQPLPKPESEQLGTLFLSFNS